MTNVPQMEHILDMQLFTYKTSLYILYGTYIIKYIGKTIGIIKNKIYNEYIYSENIKLILLQFYVIKFEYFGTIPTNYI